MDSFDMKLFENPPSEYRGKPFWAWNCKLNAQTVVKQLGYFEDMGLGGATIHCRTGLDTPYLGEEFMHCVRCAVQEAEKKGLKIGLYDEDRWPSGAAGGYVTKDVQYRVRCLILSTLPPEQLPQKLEKLRKDSVAKGRLSAKATLLAVYEVHLKNGILSSYRTCDLSERPQNGWYAYLQVGEDSAWYNNQCYVDTLNPNAIKRFLEVTHETYRKHTSQWFGNTITSIFTDEPQFIKKTFLATPEQKTQVVLPYTDDFEQSYFEQYQESFLEHLPQVVWQVDESQAPFRRYRYHEHLCERFARAFSDIVWAWCRENGLPLTGHMMAEPTLESQSSALGEAMRQYRGFEIPGIDMLCDKREFTTAKQAQSAAHQMGKNKVTSELYGVTGWDFDWTGHKMQGDWQAALGVTERVHHLSWMSMAGEAKRDYPASIFFQLPWYRQYSTLEDHFARVNVALQSGKPNVRVGVIHPIESYWLFLGPKQQTQEAAQHLETRFQNVVNWLLFGLIDFDFISEGLMEHLQPQEGNGFCVGEMEYDVVVVPGCITLRSNTYKRLKAFAEQGGTVVFMGELAIYIDAMATDAVQQLAKQCREIPFEQKALIDQLNPQRLLDIRMQTGERANGYVHQIRQLDGGKQVVFIANGRPLANKDCVKPDELTIHFKGEYKVTKFDTLTGEQAQCFALQQNGWTKVEQTVYPADSMLFVLEPGCGDCKPAEPKKQAVRCIPLTRPMDYERDEPNVLLLDQCEFSLDGEEYQQCEEVLRVDNVLRARLGYPLKMDSFAQPWVETQDTTQHHWLKLRYEVESDCEIEAVQLALENARETEVYWNGEKVQAQPDGWFTDPCIETIALPTVGKGTNILELQMPYHRKSNLEWCYLLGNFGVEICGNRGRLTQQPKQFYFQNWAMQKHPFYAGNLTLKTSLTLPKARYELQMKKLRCPLAQVFVNGASAGYVTSAPFRIDLGVLEGEVQLEICVYGSRVNAFGPVHLTDEKEHWIGPDAWRSEGNRFSYEYQLKPTGLLASPELYQYEV